MARRPRNPDWDRDETILAFDLYMRRRPILPDQDDREIVALSELLNRYARKIGSKGDRTLRNANGVSMKVANLSRHDPDDKRAGLSHGANLEAEIWEEFGRDPARLATVAAAIRAAIEADDLSTFPPAEDDGTEEAVEGRILTGVHRKRERDRRLVRTKKARALRAAGRLICEGCGFDYVAAYGKRGEGYMEAHHTLPLHEIVEEVATKLADLALVCANCHRMIHARRPWLTMGELREALQSAAGGKKSGGVAIVSPAVSPKGKGD